MDTSTLSSLDKDYDDGVYDKANPPSRRAKRSRSKSPGKKPNRLPALMLVCLVSLLIFSTIGTTASGLYFNRRVAISITSTDCLGQSWIMFSSILGFLYIILHVQSARKGEPINRTQPPSQHPLHSATLVVARLDTIAWMVSLIIAAVVVAKRPTPIFYVNLVACSAVTPTITIILCVDEKAVRPFDLPFLTSKSSASSLVTIRVSALVDNMPEVTTEDSISRRGSFVSPHNSNRPNSHTQHAAAVAAANPGNAASVSGPRPPPRTVKEARPWAFTQFDNRTKTELAASVDQASYASDTRIRVGGPRPLADSDIAIKRGVLAPPVCSDPKVQRLPERKLQKTVPPEGSIRDGSSGGWTKDWSTLKAETGYVTPANSTDGTPMSTPRVPLGVPLFSSRIASRTSGALSPVVEVSEKRSSGGSSGSSNNARPATAPAPAVAVAPAPAAAPRVWTTTSSQHSGPVATSRPPSLAGPRSQSHSQAPQFTTARYGRTLSYDNTGALRSPPPEQTEPSIQTETATTAPAPTAARAPVTRVRLVRAQDSSMRVQPQPQSQSQPQVRDRPSYDTASLRRPPRLTGELRTTVTSEVRTPEDDRLFFVNPPPPARPMSNNSGITNMVRCPGSWRESWRQE